MPRTKARPAGPAGRRLWTPPSAPERTGVLPLLRRGRTVSFFPEPKSAGADGRPAWKAGGPEAARTGEAAKESSGPGPATDQVGKPLLGGGRSTTTLQRRPPKRPKRRQAARWRTNGATARGESGVTSAQHPERGWILKARSARTAKRCCAGERSSPARAGRNPVLHVWGTEAGSSRAGPERPGRSEAPGLSSHRGGRQKRKEGARDSQAA